jgi:hypothetical protein
MVVQRGRHAKEMAGKEQLAVSKQALRVLHYQPDWIKPKKAILNCTTLSLFTATIWP